MCRSIKTLYNFEPPATEQEIRAAALQFVRKLSGFSVPSKANQEAFERAVDEVAATAGRLIDSLVTTAEPRDRAIEAERARARSAARFGT
ncbi:DUF2277 domain-containing protein [Variovorax paradoxus]|uniref:DUF2277 family protein n=1 Tax=Variovorax paradoxus TaxID=34073 RepID=A0A6I6HE34_VARPD|nr:DUF2277 domain-containing protein [Variovorax paradoxus]QGW81324.1 DUF2277 family protein [Variovorax paradoxus]